VAAANEASERTLHMAKNRFVADSNKMKCQRRAKRRKSKKSAKTGIFALIINAKANTRAHYIHTNMCVNLSHLTVGFN